MPDNFPFLTVDVVAEQLGITQRAVGYMLNRGEFPNARKLDPAKETSPWLIPPDDLKAVLKKRGQAAKAT